MKKEKLISLNDFRRHYKVEASFIQSLREYDLIQITTVEKKSFIHSDHLPQLEKLMRLHYDLNVNMEGIDVINRLLLRLETMQRELIEYKNKTGE